MAKKSAESAKASVKTGAKATVRVSSQQVVPRKGTYDAERLLQVSERLRQQAAKIKAMSKAMTTSEINDVEIDGHGMLLRAFKQVNNFIAHGTRSISDKQL